MAPAHPEPLVLVGDVGGTHLNLALVALGREGLVRTHSATFSSPRESSLEEPVRRFLQDARTRGLAAAPLAACFAGAGPVADQRIALTNLPWAIDGGALAAEFGFPVRVINDFTALAHGVLRLEHGDRSQILPLPHPDGATPAPDPAGMALLVGAGTGLGVGFATVRDGSPLVLPSEGGHVGLPIFGEDSLALWSYLAARLPGPPGAESAVSGPGIARILAFLVDTGRAALGPEVAAVLALPEEDRPRAIAEAADTVPAFARALDLFIDTYARVCADLAAVVLPSRGLFLAGGIAAKHEARFLAGHRFMARFARNYRPHLDALARATPVYIVRDYSLSLSGAAHAARELIPSLRDSSTDLR